MATLQHNISGTLTVALLNPGDNISNIKSISIANTNRVDSLLVDLYVGTISSSGTAAVNYYLMKGRVIHKGDTITLDSENLKFKNVTNALGMFITLGSSTDTVDVIISK